MAAHLFLTMALAAAPPPMEPLPPIIRSAPLKAERPAATSLPPCSPHVVTAMTVRVITPGLQAGDPRAQPRRIWRLGDRFLRNLDEPLAPSGDQMLVIVAEPDIWQINLAKGVAQHSIDDGKDKVVRAPILPVGAPPEFMALEFGCEAEFVAVRAPVPARTLRWGGLNAGIHTYTLGDQSLSLLMDEARGIPLMVTYGRAGRPVYMVRYDAYGPLPDQPALFQPPAGVMIVERPRASKR